MAWTSLDTCTQSQTGETGVDRWRVCRLLEEVFYLFLLDQRRDEAAFVCRSVGDWVDHHVTTEEIHRRLGRWEGNRSMSDHVHLKTWKKDPKGGAGAQHGSLELTWYSLKLTSPNCPLCKRFTSSTCSSDRTMSLPVCLSWTVLLHTERG